MNINPILNAAQAGINPQSDTFNTSSGPVAEALQVAREKAAEENKAALGKTLLELIRTTQTVKEDHRAAIRNYNKVQKDKLDKIDRAARYGEETGNFLPLCVIVGAAYGSDYRNSFPEVSDKVPEDWQPSDSDS